MKRLILNRNGSYREFLEWYFRFLTETFGITIHESERELLVEFMSLSGKPVYEYDRFGRISRNRVIQEYNNSGRKMTLDNLNTKLSNLKKRNIIFKEEDGLLRLNKNIAKGIEEARRGSGIIIEHNFKIDG